MNTTVTEARPFLRFGAPSNSRPRSALAARAAVFLGGSAPMLVIGVAISVQTGSALATKLFHTTGPVGAVWLRSAFALAIVLPIASPRLVRLTRRAWAEVLSLGVVLAAMNVCFYEAIARIPLGVAATVDYLGPLLVAVAGSRGIVELAAVALAGSGVALLGAPSGHVNGVGLAFALAAAACWSTYLLLAKRTVARVAPIAALAGALVVGAVALAPAALLNAGSSLGGTEIVGIGLGVALLSSALPLLLELLALRLVSASAFSVLLSLEPAVAALIGFILLRQKLKPLELIAVACVVVASASAGFRARTPPVR